MNTFARKDTKPRSRAVTNDFMNRDTGSRAMFQPLDHRPAAITQRALQQSMNQSSKVQSQLQLQRMFDQSPRVAAQMKLAEVLSGRKGAQQTKQAIQRQEALEDEEMVQRQAALEEEEEPLQEKSIAIQREAMLEDEEPLQGNFEPVQREQMAEEEEPLQGKFTPLQREGMLEEEEPLQGKFEPLQLEAIPEEEEPLQEKSEPMKEENNTGLPGQLKAGVENLSGLSMDDVRVHYNSAQPAQLHALAYTQGTDIHIAPGQERHLPHEAWHVVQQKTGRVRPMIELKGASVNTDVALESEADRMGAEAKREPLVNRAAHSNVDPFSHLVTQRSPMNTTDVTQLAGNVIQLEGEWIETFKGLCVNLWDLIKKSHTTKTAPAILNILILMTSIIRTVRDDSSVGAQFGSGLLVLLTSLDAAVTAAEEWNAATGEGKELWKTRADAVEKVVNAVIIAATLFTLPFSVTTGTLIGVLGGAGVKAVRGVYDWVAHNVVWRESANQEGYVEV